MVVLTSAQGVSRHCSKPTAEPHPGIVSFADLSSSAYRFAYITSSWFRAGTETTHGTSPYDPIPSLIPASLDITMHAVTWAVPN